MIELVLNPSDLLAVRFAISPAEEILGAVRTIADPAAHAEHLPWRRQLSDPRPLRGLEELALLVTSREPPDFLSPPPTSPVADLADQLRRMEQTPDDVVADELHRAIDVPPPVLRDPAAARALLATQMRRAWRRLLAGSWPQMSALLQGDIQARGRRLALQGVRAVFDGLHPRVRWTDDVLRIEDPDFEERVELSGDGLLLVPSVFTWPDVQLMLDAPWQTTLVYPAPGVAGLWQPPRAAPTLARAFGRTRGALLSELTDPATTTVLARRHRAAPSTISAHLVALRDAGLLTATRDGRSTYYQLSTLGYALLNATRG